MAAGGTLQAKKLAIGKTAANHIALKWAFDTGDVLEYSPAVGADGTIYTGPANGDLYALSPAGSLAWRPRVRPRTSCPSRCSRGASLDPTYPVAPVTRILTAPAYAAVDTRKLAFSACARSAPDSASATSSHWPCFSSAGKRPPVASSRPRTGRFVGKQPPSDKR